MIEADGHKMHCEGCAKPIEWKYVKWDIENGKMVNNSAAYHCRCGIITTSKRLIEMAEIWNRMDKNSIAEMNLFVNDCLGEEWIEYSRNKK